MKILFTFTWTCSFDIWVHLSSDTLRVLFKTVTFVKVIFQHIYTFDVLGVFFTTLFKLHYFYCHIYCYFSDCMLHQSQSNTILDETFLFFKKNLQLDKQTNKKQYNTDKQKYTENKNNQILCQDHLINNSYKHTCTYMGNFTFTCPFIHKYIWCKKNNNFVLKYIQTQNL